MNIENGVSKLKNIAEIQKVSDNEYELITGAKIAPKVAIQMNIVEENGVVKFTDKKSTLKYMNNLYELKSVDVKNCIAAVIKVYGFSISSGELVGIVKSEDSLVETFYNFIICIGQLANMYVFFDKP